MIDKKVSVFTDGSSRGNPGKGGWGSIIEFHNKVIEIAGKENMTTNNRMEMTAIIESLKYIKNNIGIDLKVDIHSDSGYVISGITVWIYGWEKNNWKNSAKKDVLNRDLWEEMISLVREFSNKIDFVKVKGHSGVVENERADLLCTSYADGDNIRLFSGNKEDYIEYLKGL